MITRLLFREIGHWPDGYKRGGELIKAQGLQGCFQYPPPECKTVKDEKAVGIAPPRPESKIEFLSLKKPTESKSPQEHQQKTNEMIGIKVAPQTMIDNELHMARLVRKEWRDSFAPDELFALPMQHSEQGCANPASVIVPVLQDCKQVTAEVAMEMAKEHGYFYVPYWGRSLNEWTVRNLIVLPRDKKRKYAPTKVQHQVLIIMYRLAVMAVVLREMDIEHGDAHPGNIVISDTDGYPHLIDFGQAYASPMPIHHETGLEEFVIRMIPRMLLKYCSNRVISAANRKLLEQLADPESENAMRQLILLMGNLLRKHKLEHALLAGRS